MLKGLFIKSRAQIIPATEEVGEETVGQSVVHRRVEITVQRETISILVPGPPASEAKRMGRGERGSGVNCKDEEPQSVQLPSGKAPGS